jgi:hypothetical protein
LWTDGRKGKLQKRLKRDKTDIPTEEKEKKYVYESFLGDFTFS